jgi:uncharacterized protein involved in exopolysaccharide biosynthesis
MQNFEQNEHCVDPTGKQPLLSVDVSDSNEFVSYARELWGARGFIVKTAVIGAVVSVILAFLLPKKYESTTRLMPPSRGTSQASALLAAAAGPLADAGANALGIQSPSAIYEQVLQSRTVQDHLIAKYDLRHVYGTSTDEDTRLRLTAATAIADDRKSGVFTVMVTASSPQLAAALANAYVEELNNVMVDLDTSAAHRQRVFLESRLKGIQQDLDNYSGQLSQFVSKNAVVVGEEQSKAVFTAAETLRGKVISAKADLLALQQTYTPDNQRVHAAQARLDELNRQLSQMRGGTGQESSPQGFPSISQLPLLGAKYAPLYRQMVVEESVYEALTKQYEIAKVDEARDLPTVRVLDPANVPEKKSWPKRSLLLLLGTLVSILLACGWILVRGWWSESLSPWRQFAGEVAAEITHLPGLGKVAAEDSEPGRRNE